MFLRKSALEDIRLRNGDFLDSTYFAYWEDTDLALRLALRGWKCLFHPEMIAWHAVSGSLGEKPRLVDKPPFFQRVSLTNRYRTIIKNLPRKDLISLLPFLAATELLIIPYFLFFSPRTLVENFQALWQVFQNYAQLIEQRREIQKGRLANCSLKTFFKGW